MNKSELVYFPIIDSGPELFKKTLRELVVAKKLPYLSDSFWNLRCHVRVHFSSSTALNIDSLLKKMNIRFPRIVWTKLSTDSSLGKTYYLEFIPLIQDAKKFFSRTFDQINCFFEENQLTEERFIIEVSRIVSASVISQGKEGPLLPWQNKEKLSEQNWDTKIIHFDRKNEKENRAEIKIGFPSLRNQKEQDNDTQTAENYLKNMLEKIQEEKSHSKSKNQKLTSTSETNEKSLLESVETLKKKSKSR